MRDLDLRNRSPAFIAIVPHSFRCARNNLRASLVEAADSPRGIGTHVETLQQQDSASNAFNKLDAHVRRSDVGAQGYRTGGEQKMTVQHVHVAEGGQAIVGNVSAPAEGGGARKKSEVQPHALAYAPGVEMPRQIEAERVTVPSAGGAGV